MPQFAGDVGDMLISQTLNPFVRAAQQILIQVEYRDIRVRPKLLLQRAGVTGNAAHLIICTDDREAK